MAEAQRSSLFMAINNPRFIHGFWRRNSDAVSLDFEDAVGEPHKEYARTLPRQVYPLLSLGNTWIRIRINHLPWFADLEGCVWPGLRGISHPKSEQPAELRQVDAKLTELERKRGIRPGTIALSGAVETVRAVTNGYELAVASKRSIGYGSSGWQFDMVRDFAIEAMGDWRAIDAYDKGECALIADAHGLKPGRSIAIGATAAGNVVQGDTAFAEAEAYRKAGMFGGLICLHPNRVDGLNRGMTPPPGEVAEMEGVIAFFEELDARGEVEGELNGKLIDRWEAGRARRLIEWSEACGRKDRQKAAARVLLEHQSEQPA